eukprot:5040131-Prymnesium_polylepis.2
MDKAVRARGHTHSRGARLARRYERSHTRPTPPPAPPRPDRRYSCDTGKAYQSYLSSNRYATPPHVTVTKSRLVITSTDNRRSSPIISCFETNISI